MRWVQIALLAVIVWIELPVSSSTGVDRRVCGVGEFDSRGECVQCPGGTFGALPGLTNSQCSGKCSGGFFCPPGSTSARQQPCGGSNFYCLPGSAAPLTVNDGFYTTIPQVSIAQEQQHPCEPGYFCTFGIRRPCPAGTFGNTPRLATAACSRSCPAGFYCPEGTDEPLPCPPGTFGADKGITTAACSGLCPLGRYWYAAAMVQVDLTFAGLYIATLECVPAKARRSLHECALPVSLAPHLASPRARARPIAQYLKEQPRACHLLVHQGITARLESLRRSRVAASVPSAR